MIQKKKKSRRKEHRYPKDFWREGLRAAVVVHISALPLSFQTRFMCWVHAKQQLLELGMTLTQQYFSFSLSISLSLSATSLLGHRFSFCRSRTSLWSRSDPGSQWGQLYQKSQRWKQTNTYLRLSALSNFIFIRGEGGPPGSSSPWTQSLHRQITPATGIPHLHRSLRSRANIMS